MYVEFIMTMLGLNICMILICVLGLICEKIEKSNKKHKKKRKILHK